MILPLHRVVEHPMDKVNSRCCSLRGVVIGQVPARTLYGLWSRLGALRAGVLNDATTHHIHVSDG